MVRWDTLATGGGCIMLSLGIFCALYIAGRFELASVMCKVEAVGANSMIKVSVFEGPDLGLRALTPDVRRFS